MTHFARGDFCEAIALFERNVALEGDLRYERFGAPGIQWALSAAFLGDALSQHGRFDEAFEHAEAALRVADTAAQPFTLYNVLFSLGLARLRRRDLARAIRALERSLDGCRTWQLVGEIQVAATLGAAYALSGRVDEAPVLIAGAVEPGARHRLTWWTVALLGAATTCLSTQRTAEAAGHAREALAVARRTGARGNEAEALYLAGDVASASSTGAPASASRRRSTSAVRRRCIARWG